MNSTLMFSAASAGISNANQREEPLFIWKDQLQSDSSGSRALLPLLLLQPGISAMLWKAGGAADDDGGWPAAGRLTACVS